MKLKRWLAASAAALVLTIAGVYGIGAILPREHRAKRAAVIQAESSRLAALVRTVREQPRWLEGVESIEIVEEAPGRLLYREHGDNGSILFAFREEQAGRRFVSTIADPELPFSGEWTIDLAAAGAGTRVTIEEVGEVSDPLYRFFAAIVFGHTATMDRYLHDLTRAGEAR
jgi:Polyketide cyclase / dehydrase and lipid transport